MIFKSFYAHKCGFGLDNNKKKTMTINFTECEVIRGGRKILEWNQISFSSDLRAGTYKPRSWLMTIIAWLFSCFWTFNRVSEYSPINDKSIICLFDQKVNKHFKNRSSFCRGFSKTNLHLRLGGMKKDDQMFIYLALHALSIKENKTDFTIHEFAALMVKYSKSQPSSFVDGALLEVSKFILKRNSYLYSYSKGEVVEDWGNYVAD